MMKLPNKLQITVLTFIVFFVLSLVVLHFMFDVTLQSIPRWAIGVYKYDKQFNLLDFRDNPVFTASDFKGLEAMFVADPYIHAENDSLYMFYEVGVKHSRVGWRGDIALATSSNGTDWDDHGIILSDNVILSFPNVFKINNEYYMTVDSNGAENLRLFKAKNFPIDWVCIGTLLHGRWNDPVLISKDGIFYLFSSLRGTDTLHLFHSDKVSGPYVEHPASPLIKADKRYHRNAGRIFSLGNSSFRSVQDCSKKYGEKVRIMKIDVLNVHEYSEIEIEQSPILSGSGKGWNKEKMHTFNPFDITDSTFFAVVDGTPVNYEYKIRIFKRKR